MSGKQYGNRRDHRSSTRDIDRIRSGRYGSWSECYRDFGNLGNVWGTITSYRRRLYIGGVAGGIIGGAIGSGIALIIYALKKSEVFDINGNPDRLIEFRNYALERSQKGKKFKTRNDLVRHRNKIFYLSKTASNAN